MKGLLSKFTSNAALNNTKNKEQSKSKNSSAIKSMQIDFNNNKQSVSNTFRQIGGINTKFKTSKNSPEKNINERNFSQERFNIKHFLKMNKFRKTHYRKSEGSSGPDFSSGFHLNQHNRS